MEQGELKKVRKLAFELNASITETTAIIGRSEDGPTKTLLADSLADMQRASLILDRRLRLEKNPPSAR
jgi:hypothetical protein